MFEWIPVKTILGWLANQATATFLDQRGLPSIRRVVRNPERWDRIVSLAASLGVHLPAEPDVRSLEAFLKQQQRTNPAHFADLSLAVIKLLGRGEYVLKSPGEEAPGHFGLAVQNYSHSTAPNRRYPDLITQRLLKAAFSGNPSPYSAEALSALAEHCTERENEANKVERFVKTVRPVRGRDSSEPAVTTLSSSSLEDFRV